MKLNHNSVSYGVSIVDDLELIENPLLGDTVVVTEEGRGGVFIYRADGTSNGGTIFDSSSTGKWHRQYEGSVNVKWFGAKGDGVTDDSLAFSKSNFKEDIYIPNGSYKINVELSGNIKGEKQTYIIPYDINKAAITIKNHNESWKYCSIENLSFTSINQTGIGIDFKDFVVGRYTFSNIFFRYLNIGINRNLGNIGIALNSCDFEYNNYAIKNISHTEMHNGNIYIDKCQFSEQKICCIYFDSDPSQAIINNSIFEYNNGIDIFVKNGSGINTYNDIYPSSINNCYFEGNYHTSVTIDGVVYAGSCMRFINSHNFTINKSNFSTIYIKNSALTTNSCYFTGSIEEEGECNLTNINALMYVNQNNKFDSIRGKTIETVNYNHFVQKRLTSFKFIDKKEIKGNILYSYSPYQIQGWDSSYISIMGQSNLPFARIVKTAGAWVRIGADSTITTTKKYFVSYLIAKTSSNLFKVTAPSVNDLPIKTTNNEFVMYATICKDYTSVGTRFTITTPDNTSSIDVAQIGVVEFDLYQEALDFINNGNIISYIYNNNLEGNSIDFNQILNKEYWKTTFSIDFDFVEYYSTKVALPSCTNVPSGLFVSNYPECVITKTYDSLSFEFTSPTRKSWIDKNGKRYIILTSV